LLKPYGKISLPSHILDGKGGFDHADVYIPTGRVFVAHTANGTIEVIDGNSLSHIKTIKGCKEASGILCSSEAASVFAASRGSGRILVIDPITMSAKNEFNAGSKPNGLASDRKRKTLLIADISDDTARLVDVASAQIIAVSKLPGRPRWSIFDSANDRFLVNIKEPSKIVILEPQNLKLTGQIPISSLGAHGLESDNDQEAFVACDSAELVKINLKNRTEWKTKIPLSGPPDVLWRNQKSGLLYCAIGRPGVVETIDTKAWRLVDSIPTEEGAHTLTFDQARQLLYVFQPKSSVASIFKEE
jgi:DNA-binding beta-propeller fold protein YncE